MPRVATWKTGYFPYIRIISGILSNFTDSVNLGAYTEAIAVSFTLSLKKVGSYFTKTSCPSARKSSMSTMTCQSSNPLVASFNERDTQALEAMFAECDGREIGEIEDFLHRYVAPRHKAFTETVKP
ncbi:hypothetical protein [Oxynema aestuarii]|jgi:hypothetical protein|uniref:Uncharacterized protein n=1 Tax=Oxynema aestuarii AP17 TaxID=2064643 RepID=A0A6H1TVJ2_9CYAN|nr:hypothetical protein [Oxynema aestuarii]QIZ69773.1 hypothetical protein HCG48_03575 [Oxynema aestuarii AP17]